MFYLAKLLLNVFFLAFVSCAIKNALQVYPLMLAQCYRKIIKRQTIKVISSHMPAQLIIVTKLTFLTVPVSYTINDFCGHSLLAKGS